MLRYRLENRNPFDLKLGRKFRRVSYEWRPFHERPPDHREDYRLLFWSLYRAGCMVNPLIASGGGVLIGMRRLEIARLLDWPQVPVAEIIDDISDDPDPGRVLALRDEIYKKVSY